LKSVNQQIELEAVAQKGITLYLKREDLLHAPVSGNKYRKLKYNIKHALSEKYRTILTFGGAFSNHIAATAAAANSYGLNAIGIIRGDELEKQWRHNPTLSYAASQGMQLKFISRTMYREKENASILLELRHKFGDFYYLPEGGTNPLAILGCEEILVESDKDFDYVCCAVGTGGTMAGLCNSTFTNQTVLGFPALKGSFLKEDIRKFTSTNNWRLQYNYHFGGYAKVTRELIVFMNTFKKQTQIPLDAIYTGKMVFGVLDMIAKNYFTRGTRILMVHTGGLQGNEGMNMVLKKKKLPLLDL